VTGCCEKGNESSVPIKYGKCLEWLRNCQLLDEGCAACCELDR
jgi:hypothetical protein